MLHYLASLKQYCHRRHDFLLVMKQETVLLLNNLMTVLSSLHHVKNHSNCNCFCHYCFKLKFVQQHIKMQHFCREKK